MRKQKKNQEVGFWKKKVKKINKPSARITKGEKKIKMIDNQK